MRCEEAQNDLNARADGELRAENAAALEAHLAECPRCKSAAEELPVFHSELRRAFAPQREAAQRVAENVAAKIRESAALPASIAPVAARGPDDIAWAQVLAAVAAG